MSRFPLEIERYMSSVVILVAPNQPVSEAIRLMRLHEVRHLPVVSKGQIVGLVSQRDIYLMRSLEPSDPSQILVSEVMTSDPYTVEPEEPVDVVAREMARRKIGSVLVTHNGKLLGLFTATDALLALAALVEDDRVPGEDDVVRASSSVAPTAGSRKEGRDAVRKARRTPARKRADR